MKLFSLSRYTAFALFVVAPLVLALTQVPRPASGEQATVTVPHNSVQQSVTIIVLDMSGSMQVNDPQGLRCSAADAYIDLSGIGNYIGIIGLDNNNGNRGGPHNFQLAQQWANPIEMSTLSNKQSLKDAIQRSAPNCRPDQATPTYDALNQAFNMLQQTIQQKSIPGSVILLTDGVPDPDTSEQIDAIQNGLLPEFKSHSWPIDTIALGADDGTFHSFLSSISNATEGNFYDDANGVIQGQPSPLNIAPFFVDVFARYQHRTVKDDIGATLLDEGTKQRNFYVTSYTDNLDIIVIKDTPATQAILKDPQGQDVSTQTLLSSDPYYQIFSIDQPQEGQWELDVSGSGQFMVESLKTSAIQLLSPTIEQNNRKLIKNAPLAIGQPFTISTTLTSHGQEIIDSSYSLTAQIAYNGGTNVPTQLLITLDDKDTLGTYSGQVTIPNNYPPGSYTITIAAGTVSLANSITALQSTVKVELFPSPFLLSPQTQQPTEHTVNATAVQWDPLLQILYSLPLTQWLGRLPLQNLPSKQDAIIAGQIRLHQQPYTHAQVAANAVYSGSNKTIPVQITNSSDGYFSIQVLTDKNGNYTIYFQTSGSFADSYGDFSVTQRNAYITLTPASLWQELWAWGITICYILCLLALASLIRYSLMPHPFGGWVGSKAGEIFGSYSFKRARRSLIARFLHPNLIYSRQVNMPQGLCFRFRRSGSIEVQPIGRGSADWQNSAGKPLKAQFQKAHELRFRPRFNHGKDEPATYLIKSQVADRSFDEDASLSDHDEDIP